MAQHRRKRHLKKKKNKKTCKSLFEFLADVQTSTLMFKPASCADRWGFLCTANNLWFLHLAADLPQSQTAADVGQPGEHQRLVPQFERRHQVGFGTTGCQTGCDFFFFFFRCSCCMGVKCDLWQPEFVALSHSNPQDQPDSHHLWE